MTNEKTQSQTNEGQNPQTGKVEIDVVELEKLKGFQAQYAGLQKQLDKLQKQGETNQGVRTEVAEVKEQMRIMAGILAEALPEEGKAKLAEAEKSKQVQSQARESQLAKAALLQKTMTKYKVNTEDFLSDPKWRMAAELAQVGALERAAEIVEEVGGNLAAPNLEAIKDSIRQDIKKELTEQGLLKIDTGGPTGGTKSIPLEALLNTIPRGSVAELDAHKAKIWEEFEKITGKKVKR